jgi:hypothetical protein
MESFEESSKSGASSKAGFIKHVFNFDDDSKGDILNVVQYSAMGLIPIVILNKLMQRYVPEADDQKGSIEILAEVLIQSLVMFLGLLLINRVIIYVPTYSGIKYPEFNVIYIVLATLMITLSLQTKLGEKVGILTDRVGDLWNGYSQDEGGTSQKKKQKKARPGSDGSVRVTQPISSNPQMEAFTSAPSFSTPIGDLPTLSQIPQHKNQTNYDAMYQNQTTPMPGAATPGEGFEPMAANAVGGGAFGSAFGGGF